MKDRGKPLFPRIDRIIVAIIGRFHFRNDIGQVDRHAGGWSVRLPGGKSFRAGDDDQCDKPGRFHDVPPVDEVI